MKLKNLRKQYQYYSEEASKISRNLALAGFAIIWVFKIIDEQNKIGFDSELVNVAFFLALTLFFDFLHYVAGTITWSAYNRHKERESLDEGKEFSYPRWINYPTLTFFYSKLFTLTIAYLILIVFLFSNISHIS